MRNNGNFAENIPGIFNVCINYGSRAEIWIDATKRKIATLVSASKLKIEDINEEGTI